jgi:hypothetical protein
MSHTLHTIAAATVTHTTAVIHGEITSDIAVYHARTTDARIGLTFGTTLMSVYSADATQGLLEAFATARNAIARLPRLIATPATPPYAGFARTTLSIEWTRRPSYCVVPQSGPGNSNGAVMHWVDLYCGPLTFQIRDQLGLKSTLELLTRAHQTAVAIFLDGPNYAADPTSDDYRTTG